MRASSLRRLPIRWRLTLASAALLAVALLLFGVALYFGLRQRLNSGLDEQLQDQAEVVLATTPVEGTPDLAAIRLDGAGGDVFLRVLDARGTVVTDSGYEGNDVPLDSAAVTAAIAGQARIDRVTLTGDDVLQILTTPMISGAGQTVGVLQIGLDRDEIDEALAALLAILVLAVPLVLLVAVGGGYLLAGRALAPVATITDLARRIDAADLKARLDLDLPDDELGRLARTFDEMLARIEDAFERQRRFTGDAAHELRTPLSLLRAQVDLALARPRSAHEYRAALRDVDRDLARLTDLVATLLTLARADAGRLTPDLAPFALDETIAALLDHTSPAARTAEVTLQAATVPTRLVADETLLTRALLNLLDNALTHTPPGGTITVGCETKDKQVRLWVADTGPGIAPEHQARVFDRFYRVDTGRTRVQGGAGLGLAICKAIAEAHGGTIALTSTPGQGTRIDLILPAAPPVRTENSYGIESTN